MDPNKSSIIVPYDFSEKADMSILHAVQIAKVVDNNVVLIYLREDGGLFSSKMKMDHEEKKIKELFDKKIEELRQKFSFDLDYFIYRGKLKSVFNKISQETKAGLLITPPVYTAENCLIRAVDFINYLKDINVPVIITKKGPIHLKYREIVVPVEYDKKYKEELKWIIYLAKHFQCNINLIRPHYNDPLKKKYLDNNIFFTKKMLDSNNIIYGIKLASPKKDFKSAIYDFANSIDSDIIIIMSYKFKDYVCDKNYNVIESESIPIMSINPRADLKNYAGFY